MPLVVDGGAKAVIEWLAWWSGDRQSVLSRQDALRALDSQEESASGTSSAARITKEAVRTILHRTAQVTEVQALGFVAFSRSATFAPVLQLTFFVQPSSDASVRSANFERLSNVYADFDERMHGLIATAVEYVDLSGSGLEQSEQRWMKAEESNDASCLVQIIDFDDEFNDGVR